MDRDTRRAIEEYRRTEAGPIENKLIDELVGGELDREEFLRSGAHVRPLRRDDRRPAGVRRRGGGAQTAPALREAVKRGGTLRVGITVWGGSLEPYLLNEGGSLAFAGIPAEYLTFTNPQGRVVPWLATSWKPNANATVWTFQIRKGVKFHNGKTHDREGRRREHEAVREREGLERGPDPVLRPRGRHGEGRLHGGLPAQAAHRRVPVPRQPDDVPGAHPARGDRGQARARGSRAG